MKKDILNETIVYLKTILEEKLTVINILIIMLIYDQQKIQY